MRGFDVLDPHLDLTKSYFLEASAGTGKTFTIENIVVRLIQDKVPVDKILVVTFTRAATLELKMRIRKRLEEQNNYTALAAWDEANIFTIHGFCYHTLKNHAFETGFSLTQNEKQASFADQKQILKDFLRTSLPAHEIHPKQIEKILAGRHPFECLLEALTTKLTMVGRSYQSIQEDVTMILKRDLVRPKLEELLAWALRFKGFCNKAGQLHSEYVRGLQKGARLLQGESEDLIDLPLLKMVPDNLKKGAIYPEALVPLNRNLFPFLKEASDPDLILNRLKMRAQNFLTQVCTREDLFFYDDLIKQMHVHLALPSFTKAVRSDYQAVLIDEFQDTDPMQWEIFKTLFLGHLPLYIVGDPKQSIYRFRGADLYTYLEAKKALGEEAYATLTRNFRSQPFLVNALNNLFQRSSDLIQLPKTGHVLAIPPIISGIEQTHDAKIIFCLASDETSLFDFIAQEIKRLKEQEKLDYRACAILVKDRYQTEKLTAHFPLPFMAQKSRSLVETEAFCVLKDLLQAVLNPRERSSVIKVLAGPLFGYSLEELARGWEAFHVEPLYRYHALLSSNGILSFFQVCCQEVKFPNQDLYLDLWQLVELIAENAQGIETYLPYLQKLRLEDPAADFLQARVKCCEDAVQILTTHVSKGLEFEAVFPVALMREGEMEDAEERSEKMRQLYVALTRAKRYLYLPVIDHAQINTPIHFFLKHILQEKSLEEFVQSQPHCALVHCTTGPLAPAISPIPQQTLPAAKPRMAFPSCLLKSYSSLVSAEEYEIGPTLARSSHTFSGQIAALPIEIASQVGEAVLHEHCPCPLERQDHRAGCASCQRKCEKCGLAADQFPAGIETGLLLHKIFEHLDLKYPLRPFLEEMLATTKLEPWVAAIEEMVNHTLDVKLPTPFGSFSLREVDPRKMIREMEFLYPCSHGYLKGFIDLFFEHQGWYYCIDWKSNVLVDYSPQSIRRAIANHQYGLQAEIYQTAIHKYLKLFQKEERFGGSFYLFLRGLKAGGEEGIHFIRYELR
jgi:exodeoxyribonuclease V beta subunit